MYIHVIAICMITLALKPKINIFWKKLSTPLTPLGLLAVLDSKIFQNMLILAFGAYSTASLNFPLLQILAHCACAQCSMMYQVSWCNVSPYTNYDNSISLTIVIYEPVFLISEFSLRYLLTFWYSKIRI